MQKSFKQRLEVLEALEAQSEAADRGRRLEVFLQIRPADYFTCFEDVSATPAARDAIAVLYGLDQIDWQADRVRVIGGTWPGVPIAQSYTIARIELPDEYGCRIDEVQWVTCEPGEPLISIGTSGEVEQLRRAQRIAAGAGFDLLLSALEDGRADVRPLMYGGGQGQPYGPLTYGLCGMADPAVQQWGLAAERLRRTLSAPALESAAAYGEWIRAHRADLVAAWCAGGVV